MTSCLPHSVIWQNSVIPSPSESSVPRPVTDLLRPVTDLLRIFGVKNRARQSDADLTA